MPPEFGNFSNLNYLRLEDNQLSGNIPSELGNLSNLGWLGLINNQFSGSIPPELGNLSNLWYFGLSNNQLNGNIPPELSNLSNLIYLYLDNNQLSGPIPKLSSFSSLEVLRLSDNQLSGNIPSELDNLSRLFVLYLTNNQLSGPIPPELGNVSNLYELYLAGNRLSGDIPPELGDLQGLSVLDLSRNKLSGTIPASIANLPYLYSLDLSHNQFTFNGMESIAQSFTFARYSNQARLTIHKNNNALSVSAGGTLSNNTYLWYKKGRAGYTKITGDSVFHPTESGVYAVRVRNKIATNLNLFCEDTIYYTAPVALNATRNKEEIPNNSFSVYPNPAKDILHVQTNGNTSVSLLNQLGKVLLTTQIDKAGSINVSNLAAGEYYLKNNHTNASKKIAVIK